MRKALITVAVAALMCGFAGAGDRGLIDRVEHHTVNNDGVNIHYVTVGEGPVLLFVHGFPDFWYVWNHQMDALSDSYKCVALDTRASGLSDNPQGVKNYGMKLLMSDIDAVRKDIGAEKITVVAHDWGGMISWYYTMDYPDHVERLIMMNLTHPRGFSRTLANATPEQTRNTEYARNFQKPGAGSWFNAERMAARYKSMSGKAYELALESYESSDIEGMLNFYRANYFKEPYRELTDLPMVTCPVLQFHGLNDTAVDKDGLSKTWDWVGKDYTLVTYPGIGHTVQREAAERVTKTMRWWLENN